MKRLSMRMSSWLLQRSEPRDPGHPVAKVETLIVGSGYGGASAALRLAIRDAGPLWILERGSEFLPGDFPNDAADLGTLLRTPASGDGGVPSNVAALYELKAGPGVLSFVGNAVGGGSMVNAGVLARPDMDVFAQPAWPAAISADPSGLEPYFAAARAALGAQSTATVSTPKSEALERFGRGLKQPRSASALDVTIDFEHCTRCGDCASGCNVSGAKITLRDTYLSAAVARGARLFAGATVYSIRPEHPGKDGAWRVRVVPTEAIPRYRTLAEAAALAPDGAGFEIRARRVVLCAGSYGSTEILQRSSTLHPGQLHFSPALGTRFSGNGDSLSFAMDDPAPVHAVGTGADEWQHQPPASQPRVGPTITRVIDLRGSGTERPPLEDRLFVEDAAVPGAIGRLFAEIAATSFALGQLDLWRWRRTPGGTAEPLAAGHWLTGRTAPMPALPQRTQVLLCQGHDGAAGRILYVGGRDESVPYWDNVRDLRTFQVQRALFEHAARRIGAFWVPNPAWQLLPQGAGAIMHGPKPAAFMTTVHPLGGCPMGDDPATSVVDQFGRVWRCDPHGAEPEVYAGLMVLDGAIVPTSLGCNPLLTITALAERALALNPDMQSVHHAIDAVIERVPRTLTAPGPKAWTRRMQPVLPVEMEERLVLESDPRALGQLSDMLGTPVRAADLQLSLDTPDWLAMWDHPSHPVTIGGVLRVEATSGAVRVFDICADESNVQLLIAEFASLPRKLLRIFGGFPTWLALRGWRDLREAFRDPARGRDSAWAGYLANLFRGLAHATEQRSMTYRLTLRERLPTGEPGTGRRPLWLELRGEKRIAYAASLAEWHRYLTRGGAAANVELRGSYLQQVSDLRTTLATSREDGRPRRSTGPMWFRMDYRDMVERLPMRVHGSGDLVSVKLALASYVAVFGRFALKTRLFDMRLPSYSGGGVGGTSAAGNDVIGGVQGLPQIAPEAYWLDVPIGGSYADDPGVDGTRNIRIRLLRYRRSHEPPATANGTWRGSDVVRARAALLVHAFAQSGNTFTLRLGEPGANRATLAERLLLEGFDVWVLDHRLSTRLPAHREQSTIEQIGMYDVPAAVRLVLDTLRGELGLPGDAKVQLFAFAQCIGSAAVYMSLLSGKLAYPAATGADSARCARVPMLAGAVLSQTHMHSVGAPLTQARAWLPAMLRDTFRMKHVPFSVHGPQDAVQNTLMDRLFSALPVDEAERCPVHAAGEPEDDHATCRRIRFIEAPLFRHRNVDAATHRLLPQLFGDANVRLFAHAAKCVDAERLVGEDGDNSYVLDANVREHMALPIAFLHGGDNELFHPESAIRTARQYQHQHLAIARAVAATLAKHAQSTSATPEDARAAWIVPGYGHLDVLIAKDADARVFTPMAGMFAAWMAQDVARDPVPAVEWVARLPLTGPFIGVLQRTIDAEHRAWVRFDVSFEIDDRFSDAAGVTTGNAEAVDGAFVRACWPDGKRQEFRASITAFGTEMLATPGPGQASGLEFVRMASASVCIPLPPGAEPRGIQLECFSVHTRERAADPGCGSRTLHEDAQPYERRTTLLEAAVARVDALNCEERPSRPSVSRFVVYPDAPGLQRASVPSSSVALLGTGAAAERVTFFAGSCRYPGFRFDKRRVDSLLREPLGALLQGQAGADAPAFALLLGDQIYADHTAGFADELNPMERYFERHRFAFQRRPHRPELWTIGDLAAHIPTLMTPDDHEYVNGFPDEAPLVKTSPALRAAANRKVRDAATNAHRAYQSMHNQHVHVPDVGYAFDAGPARILVLDTRTQRQPRTSHANAEGILSAAQRKYIDGWLNMPDARERLCVIATGSVVVPALRPDAEPSLPGEVDLRQASPADRHWLFQRLADFTASHRHARFLLLSADYHIAAAAHLCSRERRVGGCIVAPALYAPMRFANTEAGKLWGDEPSTSLGGFSLDALQVHEGSGFGAITIEKSGGECPRYHVRVKLRSWLLEQFEPPRDVEMHLDF